MKIPITTDRGLVQRKDANVPGADSLALDPYSPTLPTRAPEPNDADPLALSPYSPIHSTRAPADRSSA